jgi:hypothetical protein
MKFPKLAGGFISGLFFAGKVIIMTIANPMNRSHVDKSATSAYCLQGQAGG